jgi:ceramide glucosyltransferase
VLHTRSARFSRTFWRDLPLLPLRDTLLALQWLAAAFGSRVVWRGAHMQVVNRMSQPPASMTEISDGG